MARRLGTVGISGLARLCVALGATVGMVSACTAPPELVDLAPAPQTAVVVPAAPDTLAPLRMSGSDLVDAAGRVVMIHGMNSVNKSAPFVATLESGWLGDQELEYLRNSGFNGIRLGVSYAAVMPEPGVVDEAYLDQVVTVVDKLSDEGLWVQLDFHQDVFHLMPEWATPDDALALSDEAPPLLSFIGWAARYMSPRSMRQWNSFVKGEPIVDGRSVASVLGDAAAALARSVESYENVIGIELLNEPFPGAPIIDCIFVGCPGRDRMLSERYSEMASPIRSVVPDMPIWIEPFAPTGYLDIPTMPAPDIAPSAEGPRIGLAWHLYCKDTDGGEPVVADDASAGFCGLRMDNGFKAGSSLARSIGADVGEPGGVPRILNEFGASMNPLDVTLVGRLADEQFVSWMYWTMPSVLGPTDSSLPDVVESQIIRPYPQATAGTPGRLSYEPATGLFSYEFLPDPTITAPTSIVVPTRAYPSGYQATVDNGSVTSSDRSGRLSVVPADGSRVVKVTLTRN